MVRLMRYFKNSPDAFISSWCPRNPLLSPVQTCTAFISLRVSWSMCQTALNSGLRACEEAAAAGMCVCVGERVTRRVSANRVSLTSCSLDREEMKSLQAALQKQLDEANERAEKQQATVRRGGRRHLTDSIRRPPPV